MKLAGRLIRSGACVMYEALLVINLQCAVAGCTTSTSDECHINLVNKLSEPGPKFTDQLHVPNQVIHAQRPTIIS